MYKVFFNDSTISISSESKISSNNNITQLVVDENYNIVDEIIAQLENQDVAMNYIIQNDHPRQIWHSFQKQLIQLPAAGGLVMNENRQLLFIKRLGVWDLPKGKIEKKESAEMASIREVKEECGLSDLKIIKQLESTFHIYRSPYHKFPHNLILKETKWFLMSCKNNQTLIPQVEENIEEVKWFSMDELDQVKNNTYSSISEFLDKTIPFI